jgi:type III secretion protein U
VGGESEEKTLPASQKKLLEARKKGQVPRSKDFTSGAALAGAAGVLLLTGSGAVGRLTALLDTAATAAARPSGWEDGLRVVVPAARDAAIGTVLPVLGAVVGMVVLSTLVALRGIPFAMDPITPKLSHINPAEGFRRLFKMRALVELVKSVIKVLLIGAILATLLVGGLRAIVLAPGCGLSCVQVTFTAQLTGLLEAAGVLSMVVGLADIGVQRWLFMRDQKMSVSEAKRERKDQDGDPVIMGHRRRLRQEEAAAPSGRALGIARATILITDGRTVAVGLRFVMSEALAPALMCRARGPRTAALVQNAHRNGVAVHEDGELADVLIRKTQPGQFIPENIYSMVIRALQAAKVI